MMKKAALSLSICLLLSAGGCKPASPSGSSGASAASQPAAPLFGAGGGFLRIAPSAGGRGGNRAVPVPSQFSGLGDRSDRRLLLHLAQSDIGENRHQNGGFPDNLGCPDRLDGHPERGKTGCHLWGRGADLYISPEKRGNPDGRHFRKHCVLRRLLLYGRGPLPATSLGRAGVSRPRPGVIRIGR